mmetsp:Transcript_40315/g.111025  ORF Transcript_40315/g.111025 Transcript_40315/m.111025 type:complete len:265 (-) Transcript_40315:37-831(-)
MAPAGAETSKAQELKEKLAQAREAKSHKAKKDPREKAKEKADAEARAKAAKEQAKKERERVAATLKAPAAAPTLAPAPEPGPFAQKGQEAQEVGIHLGISCDGCGAPPPLIGRAMKCRDCPDFDLCEDCYPERLDKARAKVAADAGLPAAAGKHPSKHTFGARLAKVVMTEAEAAAERAAAKKAEAEAAAQPRAATARPAGQQQAGESAASFDDAEEQRAREAAFVARGAYGGWLPAAHMATILPAPSGAARVLGPVFSAHPVA